MSSNPKYQIRAIGAIYCSSTGHYSATVIILDKKTGKSDTRQVDISDFRIMHKNNPYTYKGYPKYVIANIAKHLKQMADSNSLSVHEVNQEGDRRYSNLRYHEDDHLQYLININYKRYQEAT